MSSGLRIRNLRLALGWTQSMAAIELGISVRTLIRHEQGHHRRPWVRLPLLLKLGDLESAYAGEILVDVKKDRKVRVYGNTAIVISEAVVKGQRGSIPVIGTYRRTLVFVKMKNGQWQVVTFQATKEE